MSDNLTSNPSPSQSQGEPSDDLQGNLPKEEGLITQAIHESEGHRHFYMWGNGTVSGLQEVICSCGHGLQVDPKVHDIVEGKLTDIR